MPVKKNRPTKTGARDTRVADAALDEAAALLALALPAIEPPPGVKAQLLARVRGEHQSSSALAVSSEQAGWRFGSLADNAGWVPVPFPGVKMREISVDAARDTVLLYVEMRPGAAFPDHEHTATERG